MGLGEGRAGSLGRGWGRGSPGKGSGSGPFSLWSPLTERWTHSAPQPWYELLEGRNLASAVPLAFNGNFPLYVSYFFFGGVVVVVVSHWLKPQTYDSDSSTIELWQ